MKPTPSRPTGYEIRVAGHLPLHWAEWLEGLTIILDENGDTLLTGPAIDQAALHGLLRKVRDLGLTLVAVYPIEAEPPAASEVEPADPPDAQ